MGLFGNLFDFNSDGKMGAFEKASAYNVFREAMQLDDGNDGIDSDFDSDRDEVNGVLEDIDEDDEYNDDFGDDDDDDI